MGADWHVGQEVIVVHQYDRERLSLTDRRYGSTVTKIGRKWVSLRGANNDRFDAETGQIDGAGYNSPGIVFASVELFEHAVRMNRLRDSIRRALTYRLRSLSDITVIQIADLLDITKDSNE